MHAYAYIIQEEKYWKCVLKKDREEEDDSTLPGFGDIPIHAVNPNDPDSVTRAIDQLSKQKK